MDKLRVLPLVFVCSLLSTPTFAQLTTIGPDTPGVTEYVLTLLPTSTPGFFAPNLTPIALGSPPGGFDPFGDALSDPHGCLEGCFGSEGSEPGFAVFDVTFSKPVSFVSVLQMGILTFNGGYVSAYNSSIQQVGGCSGIYTQFVGAGTDSYPPGCYKVTSNIQDSPGFGNLTVSNATPDISTVLIAGYDGAPAFGTTVEFSVTPVSTPEPSTLSLLGIALAGLAIVRIRRVPMRTT